MANLTNWNPEDPKAWVAGAAKTSWRNLAISVPSLLCAFAVWMFWSVLTVRMKEAGFPFTPAQLFTLISIAGLSGATLRIPSSFLVSLAGGRNTIALTTALLIIPALGAGIALQDKTTSFSTFAVMAALSGIGGGNFASSMSNINGFFPKRLAGLALGLNAGVGNLGVSIMQFVVPAVMGAAMFGSLAGAPHLVAATGKQMWVQNGAFVWVPILAVLAVLAWFFMDNREGQDSEPLGLALLKVLGLHAIGFAATAVGVLLLLNFKLGLPAQMGVLVLTVLLCLGLMKLLPGKIKTGLDAQFLIFPKKHTWVMTVLYLMTFGSFIGFSSALPLLIKEVFGKFPMGTLNPNSPNPLAYAFLGPLVGSLVRPIGGMLSDKFKGSRVTQWSTVLMIIGALGVAHYVKLAQGSMSPEAYFAPFLGLFLLLFVATGLGNGSTFQMVPFIFEPKLAGPVLGWTSAAAAYGSFIIPAVFKTQVAAGKVEYALYGFAAFYAICLVLNWWYYARKNAEVKC